MVKFRKDWQKVQVKLNELQRVSKEDFEDDFISRPHCLILISAEYEYEKGCPRARKPGLPA